MFTMAPDRGEVLKHQRLVIDLEYPLAFITPVVTHQFVDVGKLSRQRGIDNHIHLPQQRAMPLRLVVQKDLIEFEQ